MYKNDVTGPFGRYFRVGAVASAFFVLAACGGGGGTTTAPPPPPPPPPPPENETLTDLVADETFDAASVVLSFDVDGAGVTSNVMAEFSGISNANTVAYDHGDGEVLIDYLQVPPDKPSHWPKILSNSKRLSRFVYNGTQDVLRGVSEHVTIGRATRGGKDLPNFFVLCRVD